MSEYTVAWASVGLPTGKYHKITKESLTVTFAKGETVKRDAYDTEEYRDKFDRLVDAGALVEPGKEDEPNPAYKSAFDVPLTGGAGQTEVQLVTDEANDDLDADDEGDDSEPTPIPEPNATNDSNPSTEEASAPTKPSVNASGAVWHQYAKQVGVEVAPDAKRADVIQAVEDAGK